MGRESPEAFGPRETKRGTALVLSRRTALQGLAAALLAAPSLVRAAEEQEQRLEYRQPSTIPDVIVDEDESAAIYPESTLQDYVDLEMQLLPKNTHAKDIIGIMNHLSNRVALRYFQNLQCPQDTRPLVSMNERDVPTVLQALRFARTSDDEITTIMLLFAQEMQRAGWKHSYPETSSFHTALEPTHNTDLSLEIDCNLTAHCAEHMGQRLGLPLHFATLPQHVYLCLENGRAFEMTELGTPNYVTTNFQNGLFYETNPDIERLNGHMEPLSNEEIQSFIIGNALAAVGNNDEIGLEQMHAATLLGEKGIEQYRSGYYLLQNTYMLHHIITEEVVFRGEIFDAAYHAKRMYELQDEYYDVIDPTEYHDFLVGTYGHFYAEE